MTSLTVAPPDGGPHADDVASLLDGLLDRGVTAVLQAHPSLVGRDVQVVAAYVDSAGAVRGVVMLDLPLATGLGAALALVPALRVEEVLETGSLPPDLADNLREVLNIVASLLHAGSEQLRLGQVVVAPDPVPAAAVAFLRVPRRRTDVRVTVPGYGSGVLAMVLVAP